MQQSRLEQCSETLESLNDRFSELIEDHEERLRGADTSLADGVLTVQLSELGTYVINKHLHTSIQEKLYMPC